MLFLIFFLKMLNRLIGFIEHFLYKINFELNHHNFPQNQLLSFRSR